MLEVLPHHDPVCLECLRFLRTEGLLEHSHAVKYSGVIPAKRAADVCGGVVQLAHGDEHDRLPRPSPSPAASVPVEILVADLGNSAHMLDQI